jgi:YD repeat-containing protein
VQSEAAAQGRASQVDDVEKGRNVDFTERFFNLWPDGGSGSTELIVIATVFLIAVAAIWRRRLTSVTDAANNLTTYAYDTENNLTSIQDANLNTTSFTYDQFGRVTQTNFPSTHGLRHRQLRLHVRCPNLVNSSETEIVTQRVHF